MANRNRKRTSTAGNLAAFRLGDSLTTNDEAVALQTYCQTTLTAEDYDALVLEFEAKRRDPWDRACFWSDALDYAHATMLS